MNLKITLPDPKYCNGCPCLQRSCEWDGCLEVPDVKCNIGHKITVAAFVKRPAICIKTNGE